LYKVEGDWAADERGVFDFTGAVIYCLAIFIICTGASLSAEAQPVMY
jgi:hypothetical protein